MDRNESIYDVDQDLNAFPACERCGRCCHLSILCVSHEEARVMARYIKKHGIVPVDRGPERCPLQTDEGTCMVYPVRSQTCRLYNCHVPRCELLAAHPEIIVDDNKPLIDMRRAFLYGDFSDPRDFPDVHNLASDQQGGWSLPALLPQRPEGATA